MTIQTAQWRHMDYKETMVQYGLLITVGITIAIALGEVLGLTDAFVNSFGN